MNLKGLLKKLKLSENTISTILGALVIIVIGVLIFNYFRGQNLKPAPTQGPIPTGEVKLIEENGKLVPEGLPTTHAVAQGESLWTIAEKYYGSGYNWVDISQENQLSNPNLLTEGQELTIPKVEVREPKIAEQKFGNSIEGNQYTVVKGDHLWGISVRAYGDGYKWVEIAKGNNLENPDIIEPGQVLNLPR